MQTVLVIDASSLLCRALCRELQTHDYKVIAHARSADGPPFDAEVETIVASHPHQLLTGWDDQRQVHHVVFGEPLVAEDDIIGTMPLGHELEVLASRLEAGLTDFLNELQAAAGLLARRDGGQIWVLTQEDSMEYCMRQRTTPIESRARQAAAKSFAKEMFRFGVRINCAQVQLLKEQAEPETWQKARDRLKAFTMKFKPNSATAVAVALRAFLAQAHLPIVGMIVPLGIGFTENNL